MRDVRNWKKSYEDTTLRDGLPWMHTVFEVESYRTQRWDITKTALVNGEHVLPTRYAAFFAMEQRTPYEWNVYTHQWPYSGKWTNDHSFGSSRAGDYMYKPLYHGVSIYSLEPTPSAAVLNRARDAVQAQVRNQDWNMGQFLGELPETIDMMASPSKAFLDNSTRLQAEWSKEVRLTGRDLRVLRDLQQRGSPELMRDWQHHVKRRKYGKWRYRTVAQRRKILNLSKLTPATAHRFSKGVAGGYLSFMYGIRPLMQDLYSVGQIIQNGLTSPSLATITVTKYDPEYGLPKPYNGLEAVVKGRAERGVKVSVTCKLANPLLFTLDRFGLLNPWSLGWELIPLSFVVDWFLHMGSFLQGVIPPAGIVFAHGYETYFVDNDWQCEWGTGITPIPNRKLVVYKTKPRAAVRSKSMSRFVLQTFPIPLPYLDFGVKGHVNRVISLISLGITRLT